MPYRPGESHSGPPVAPADRCPPVPDTAALHTDHQFLRWPAHNR
ncbi:hypothetical protein C731_0568 [Mycolicibacterium hassiacum DSM 44199]|uniref:Uncharacterized protein n=1 Tax=Mycolicibacterium hassiacum (strain DSM 44199 / CIP 105218 / JCM 12690 / 3849) TaxID=1122247 RepID=K5BCS2_MYCHD|nr:hypothetical protein C731_0568 [Mycolicibacterium hassiacum DSM 44199]